jgi:transcription antitermination factor NusG
MGEACFAITYENGFHNLELYSSQDACSSPRQWFALKVRTGGEPGVAATLRMRGLEVYSPMRQERRRYSDRMKVVHVAMFPGYVFCRFNITKKIPILSSPGVEYIVGFSGEPTAISDSEMSGIRRLIELGADVTPTLEAGQRVRVTHGPLEGVEGVLLRDGKGSRLTVAIQLLMRSATLHVSEDELCLAG